MRRANAPLFLILALRASDAHAHHVKVLGHSVPHSLMSLPASLLMLLGGALFFGWRCERRKVVGAALALACLPFWFAALVL